MRKKAKGTAPARHHCLICTLTVRSSPAKRLADTILPTINQLSYLPGHARRRLPPAEYDRIIAGLAALLADAQAAVAADRELLAARKAASPMDPALSLQFYKTRGTGRSAAPAPWPTPACSCSRT